MSGSGCCFRCGSRPSFPSYSTLTGSELYTCRFRYISELWFRCFFPTGGSGYKAPVSVPFTKSTFSRIKDLWKIFRRSSKDFERSLKGFTRLWKIFHRLSKIFQRLYKTFKDLREIFQWLYKTFKDLREFFQWLYKTYKDLSKALHDFEKIFERSSSDLSNIFLRLSKIFHRL